MKLLEMNHVRKSFGETEVLKDISLSVEEGEVISIIGPSGSGKSTLLRCAAFLEKMDGGELIYLGEKAAWNDEAGSCIYEKPAKLKTIQQYFSLVFQNFNLFPHYSVMKNITDAPIHVQKRNSEEVFAEARRLLAKMGLESRENAYPCELSGGQQQRVSIGRALMNNPAIVLADEPTGNLDSKNSAEIIDLLKLYNRKYNQTLIVITHDEKIALQADRIISIQDGRIARDEVMTV